MQILLRRYDGEDYVWKTATYEGETYYIKDKNGKQSIRDIQIAAIKENEYADYVVCAACGKMIRNTPEEIEKHYADMEAKRDCSKCEHIRFANMENITRVIEEGEGACRVTQTFTAQLRCGVVSWSPTEVKHAVRHGSCIYTSCRKKGTRKPNSVFMKYPGAFDTVITSDTLAAKKMKYDCFESGFFMYDMKARGTIKACVNNAGIVDCFMVHYRGNTLFFKYSEKYDKLFYQNGWTYEERYPYWLKEAKFNELHQKVKALYEGAEK